DRSLHRSLSAERWRAEIARTHRGLRQLALRYAFGVAVVTFTVKVAGSETTFPCEPREFVLDAAERAGYSMPSSCRNGACNTCEAGLLDGEVEQRGRGRRTARDGTALMCRAQPRTDLTIHPKRFER